MWDNVAYIDRSQRKIFQKSKDIRRDLSIFSFRPLARPFPANAQEFEGVMVLFFSSC